MLEDGAGALWIGTMAHGLFRYDGRSVEKVETSHLNVGSLVEDREGNIWAGTFGGGLNRLRPRAMDLMGKQSGLPFESVVSLCQDADGKFCVVGTNGQVARGNRTTWSLLPAAESAACVAADRQGTLWVGTRGQGLRAIGLRGGQVRTWWQRDGLQSNSIRAVLVAADDSVWFATNGLVSLGHLSQGKIRTFPVPPNVRNIRALVQDARGEIWIGTSDGQVLKVSGDKLVSDPGLARSVATSVRCLHATLDGGLVIGYAERGIGLLKDGRYARLSAAEGLIDDSIWQIASDRLGALWLAGAHGLCRVDLNNAIAVAEGREKKLRSTLYGYEQGLPNLQPHYGNAPAVCQSTDGRVLFSTSLGVLALTPQNLRGNAVLPPVMLERVKVDDHDVALRASRFPLRRTVATHLVELDSSGVTLRLPPDHRKFAIDFAALSYSAPENVRFRYRLDRFDNEWSTPGSERSATYSRLPAGNYTFRVIASNDAGVWNEQGATLAIAVSPFVWQTWWFRVGLLGAFTALVAAVVRFLSFQRLRANLRRAEQQAALYQERARIARDIHDDLGGSLAHVKLLSEIAVRDRAIAETADDPVRQITTTTQQMLKSLDETIWAINPRNDTLPNLISYLGQHAVEFLRAGGIQCQVDLPDHPPEHPVNSDVRHHLFLVVKEALTNVVRHSGARTVNLRVTIEGAVLHLVIEDDGRGIERMPDDALADGVRNMRQRITSIGGDFRIESSNGAGTRIELRVRVAGAA